MIFTSPVAQAIIIDPDTGQQWKWTAPDYPYLTGVSINYERKRIATITISLDITYEEGLKMMSLPSPFKQGNLLKARIGYASGEWTLWASGFLQEGGAGMSIDANGLSGQITVQGVAVSSQYKVDKKVLKEAGWDPVKILNACADGMGMRLKISTGASSALNDYKLIGERRGKAIRKKTYAFSSSLLNKSSWDVIKSICDEWNLDYWSGPEVGGGDDGRTLFISTPAEVSKRVDQDTTVRTYAIRGQIDRGNEVYPCLSWSPEGSEFASWLAGTIDPAAHGVDAADIDTDTGEVTKISVPPEDQEVAIVGSVAANSPRDEWFDQIVNDVEKSDGSQGEYVSFPVSPGSEKRAEKQVLNRQKMGNPSQKGSISTLGIPEERPGNQCRLSGAGFIYDDLYEIDKLTHSYSPGSWEMTLTVHREGTKAKTGEQKETKEGQM